MKWSNIAICGAACLIVLSASDVAANPVAPTTRKALAEAMAEVREKERVSIDQNLLKGLDPATVLSEMMAYMNARDFRVKRVAFGLVSRILSKPQISPELRKRAVHAILHGTAGRRDGVWSDAVRALQRFRSQDFDETARKAVIDVLSAQNVPSGGTRALISSIRMKEALPELKKKFEYMRNKGAQYHGQGHGGPLWAIQILMAQLGDEESIEYCVKTADADVGPRAKSRLLAQMSKIRDPRVVKLLKKSLEDDIVYEDGLGFQSHISVDAATRLAQMLEGFPKAASKYGRYELSDIPKCRKWMSEQTEWKFKEF